MKRLFLISLILLFTCLYAYGDTEVVGGGGGVSEGTDVGFGNMTATSLTLAIGGTMAAPSLSWGDGDTGFWEYIDDGLAFSVAGQQRLTFFTASMRGATDTFQINYQNAKSGTNPIYAFQGDDNTGLGSAADGQLSHIADGVEALRNHTTYSEFYPSGVGQVAIYDDGTISAPGAIAFPGISTVTVDYAVGNFRDDPTWFIECDATLGNISTTLPPIADKKGRLLEVKLLSAANGCYLDGNGAETIDGAAGQVITTQYNIISLIAGSVEWLIR